MHGKRILILVPHPDDEVVACAAAIGREQAEGAEIFALYLTHGCIARETMWRWERKNYEAHVARRRAEGEKAAAFLKITPLGWSLRPARHLWRALPDVCEEVKAAIAQHRIDQLWVPAYEGGNADHDALHAVGSLWAGKMSVLEFAEYNFSGGKAHSQEFPHPNGTERIIALTLEEKRRKQQALKIYVSETNNLNYVKADRECWRPLAPADYANPPHKGVLWYARFQWVPFRHPRVDFTQPEEVSHAIQNFLRQTRDAA
jgi:LmbE family N-acetylglucosaminyl deacetylase